MNEPFTAKQAKAVIGVCLKAGRLAWSEHGLEQMQKRGIDAAEVLRTLRGGFVGEAEWANGSWRHPVTGGRIVVVVTLPAGTSTVVVTAFRK